MQEKVEQEGRMIIAARAQGRGKLFSTYAKLSGPGWVQGAITLGGGSLAGSLYLGVLGGFSLLWLQPLAMGLGIIMLSAISYVTLSSGERPFRALNTHISPVLGWSWAIATLVASIVWCLPQFALGTAAVQQNLMPGLSGGGGKLVICALILAAAVVVIWTYDASQRGVALFELVLKIMVALIVLSFFGVVVVMTFSGGLEWGSVVGGFVPDISLLWSPAATFGPALSEVAPAFQKFWSDVIVGDQRNVMITAAATAVGINMTFLLPCSMLARGWRREFRGLANFDLVLGLLLPFVLATSCVVMASAATFHAKVDDRLITRDAEAPTKLIASYDKLLVKRLEAQGIAEAEGLDSLPLADRRMASMLVQHDSFDLARALAPLTGKAVAHFVFGLGVLGMAVSTIIVLMLISGFAVCEMLGVEARGMPRRLGSMLPAVGILGPFIWQGDAQFWLAVPTSVFGFTLLPIAYLSFFLLMNSRTVLGDDRPRGAKLVAWNTMMGVALVLISLGAGWIVWDKARWVGVAGVVLFGLLIAVVRGARPSRGP